MGRPLDQIEYLVDVQREMSRNRSMRERVRAFVVLAQQLTPTTFWCGVIAGADPASYHVIGTGRFDPDVITDRILLTMLEGPGDHPRRTGGVIGDLIASGRPGLFDDLRIPADDPALGNLAEKIRSALTVPLYWDGRIVGWSLSFAEARQAYDASILAMALNNANIVLHSVARDDLFLRVEALHARVSRQVDAVATAQRALLPEALPAVDGYAFAVSYRPCEAAGGDYYDFMRYPDGRVGTVIADASGHGTSAAVTMAVMRATMSAYKVSGRGPHEVIEDVNAVLRDAIPEGIFVTAIFVLLDPATGDCLHVTCGHPPALIRRADGSVERLDECGGPPLGIMDDLIFDSSAFRLEPGDTLLLYTDGITETFGPERRMYGIERLESVLGRSARDPETTIVGIDAAVGSFAGTSELDDDQTMLAIRRSADHTAS